MDVVVMKKETMASVAFCTLCEWPRLPAGMRPDGWEGGVVVAVSKHT
jgi:hypothetical protein